MKVLSILQPWASLVVHGHKRIETRSWNTKYRGELLIHASAKALKYDNEKGINEMCFNGMCELDGFIQNYKELCPRGAIIGKVNLDAILKTENIDVSEDVFQQSMLINSDKAKVNSNCATISFQEYVFGDYSDGRFGWILSDPVLFKEPIPCKGQLGIWNFDPYLEMNAHRTIGNLEKSELIRKTFEL